MIWIAPNGHFLGQIPQPMHKSSEIKAIFDVASTSIQSFPARKQKKLSQYERSLVAWTNGMHARSPIFTFCTVDVKGLLSRPVNGRQTNLERKSGFEYGELTHANNGARLFTKWVEIKIFDCTISVALMLRSPFACSSSSLNSPFLSTLFWFTLVRTDNGDTC